MKLTLSELAVLKGWIQGLSASYMVGHYIKDFDGNAEAFVQERLAALKLKAQRAGRPEWADLLSRRPGTEAAQRDAIEAVDQLARMPDPKPAPEHSIELWLPKRLADTCRSRGMNTVGDVIQGWRKLPRRSGVLVAEWLQDNGLVETAPPKPVPSDTALSVPPTPLERMTDPGALDGSRGDNRAPGRPRIDAANDLQAIQAWLSMWPEDSHTHKAYRREAERFLLYCLIERGKPFSSATVEDCIAYRAFLADPKPADRWIGPPRPRTAPDWKPFRGPLSDRSIHQAEIILKSLCEWLVGQRWLDSNPFAALPRRTVAVRMRTDHALTEAQWRFVLAYAETRIEQAANEEKRRNAKRLRFVLEFAYLTGLRISELAAARTGDIETVVRRERTQHWLIVQGKGGRERRVPLPPPLIARLADYLRERGWMNANPDQLPPDTPIIASVRGKTQRIGNHFVTVETPVTSRALHNLIRGFFRDASAELKKKDPAAGKRLGEASVHWLRHTHGSHALDRGVPLTVVRDNLGHASIQTTSLYVHKDADERFQEMEKLLTSFTA